MKFTRPELSASVTSLAGAADVDERCIGHNYLIEENVGDRRRQDVETYEPASIDIRKVVKSYFQDSIQGLSRGHLSSTFDQDANGIALLKDNIEPNQKIVRLERIDRHIEPDRGLTFSSLEEALKNKDQHRLSALTDRYLDYSGERPAFAAFKSELEPDLKEPDWLQRIIDRLGLYHHYPFVPGTSYRFALMEYTADEVIKQALSNGVSHCFALATVLECQNNPAFFPVPRNSRRGFTVDLRERSPQPPGVHEILHIRFDYSWKHVKRLEEWRGADFPDVELARGRHRQVLSVETDRADFGEVRI